jgi:uncharacterized membrane protein (DUF485 family)
MQHRHVTAREWDELAADPEFTALLRARRRFVIPATCIFLLVFLGLPAGLIAQPSLMSSTLPGGLTVAYAYGLSLFVVAWLLLALYLRAAKSFDDRAAAFVERAHAELSK